MSCGKKIKMTCGIQVYAPCVKFERGEDIPEYSELSGQECLDIEQTTLDLYEHVGNIKGEIDLSALGNGCLTYTNKQAKTVIKKLEDEICILKTKVEALENRPLCDMPIDGCGLDLSGIVDACDNPVTTFGELLQYLINQTNP